METIFFFNNLSIFFWNVASWQCCDSLMWTVKGLIHTYLWVRVRVRVGVRVRVKLPCHPGFTEHWAEFPVLDSRSLLVTYFKYSSVSLSIPDSLTIPPLILPPGNHNVITEYWAEFPVLDSRSLLVLHVKHSSVSMSISDSLTILSSILPHGNHEIITEYWAEFPVLDSRSLWITYFKYSSVSLFIPKSQSVSHTPVKMFSKFVSLFLFDK